MWKVESKIQTAAPLKGRRPKQHNAGRTGYRVTNGREATAWTTWPLEADAWSEMLNGGYRPVAAKIGPVPE